MVYKILNSTVPQPETFQISLPGDHTPKPRIERALDGSDQVSSPAINYDKVESPEGLHVLEMKHRLTDRQRLLVYIHHIQRSSTNMLQKQFAGEIRRLEGMINENRHKDEAEVRRLQGMIDKNRHKDDADITDLQLATENLIKTRDELSRSTC